MECGLGAILILAVAWGLAKRTTDTTTAKSQEASEAGDGCGLLLWSVGGMGFAALLILVALALALELLPK